ncbi:hypothetical protein EC991_003676 [Linnemannia zychae]|nr:hypothetical protein EC991_003676 [Linnemannia zychae]
MNGRGRGGPGAHGLRDELSMATKDKAVDQQLQNSQFYQRGLKANSATQSSNSNKGKSSKGNSSADNASMTMKNQQEMEDDEDDDGDRKLDPNMYDNVQYS